MPDKMETLNQVYKFVDGRKEFYRSSNEFREYEKWYNAMHKQYYRIFDNTQPGQPEQRNKVFFATVATTVDVSRAFLMELFFQDNFGSVSVKPLPGTSDDVAWFNKQLLKYYLNLRKSDYKATLSNVINDTTLYGTGWDFNSWHFEQKMGQVAERQKGPLGFVGPTTFRPGLKEVEDRPSVSRLEGMDCFYEPTTYPGRGRFRGYDFRVPRATVNSWKDDPRYIKEGVMELLDKINSKQASDGDDQTGLKTGQDIQYIQDDGKDVLITYYEGDLQFKGNDDDMRSYIVYYSNGIVIRIDENPWAHGESAMTMYKMQDAPRVAYGMPPALPVLPHALWKNAMYNIRLDNVLMAQAHQMVVDTNRIDPVEFYNPSIPGVVQAEGNPAAAIYQLQMQDSSHGAFVDMARLIDEDIQKAGVPDQSAGLAGGNNSETATAATIVQGNANRKLAMEARRFSESAQRSLTKMLTNIHQFMPEEIMIKVNGEDTVINKEDVQGNLEVIVENRATTDRQLRLERHMTALQLLAQATNVYGPQGIDQEFAGKIFEGALKELDYDDAEKAIKRPSAELAGGVLPSGGQPTAGGSAGAEQGISPAEA